MAQDRRNPTWAGRSNTCCSVVVERTGESGVIQAFISPQSLEWARTRLHSSGRDLAALLKVKPSKVKAWLEGEARPTFKQAQKLAATLRVPLPFLFMKTPPDLHLPLPDRRTIALRDHPTTSSDLLAVANAGKRRQDWLREYRIAQGAPPLAFVGSATVTEDPVVVAGRIRDTLELPEDHYKASRSWSEHVTSLAHAAEEAGILVLRSGIVANDTTRTLEVAEFRGLAFSDPYAPAIFVNSRDAIAAQVFTVCHEIAHLWLGESAATDSEYLAENDPSRSAIETFCDRVSAEFLVPARAFVADWETVPQRDAPQDLARRYRVSSLMVLRRGLDVGLIDRATFFRLYKIERARQTVRSRTTGGNFDVNFTVRNGRRLLESVYESVAEGRLLHREAAAILEVKPATLDRLITRWTTRISP